jgi:hypothetical protein
MEKICLKCNASLDILCFTKDKSRIDLLNVYCKNCCKDLREDRKEQHKKYCKEYRIKNIETLKLKSKEYILKNKEKRKLYLSEYKIKYPNNKSISDKKYNEKNKEKIRITKSIYRNNNIEKLTEYHKEYYKENKDNLNKAKRIYQNNRLKNDPLFRLSRILRRRINSSFKSKSFYKKNSLFQILGCNLTEAKEYIENQFIKKMSWDNYGEWHIDHIVPLSYAKTEEELIKLNHYTNLRPLWAEENLKKGKKIIEIQLKLI